MEQIELRGKNKGKFFIVDNLDYKKAIQYSWYLDKDGYVFTAKSIRLHRLLTDCPKDKTVDHINGNKLDNRRNNLRVCTMADNLKNKSISKSKYSSVYKGVYKYGRKFLAQIKHKHIGVFESEKEAAASYNEKAKQLFGSYAKLNIIT